VFAGRIFQRAVSGTTGNFHSRVASNARAARSTSASPCIGPTTCNAIGRALSS
jgi:hypothetical protein